MTRYMGVRWDPQAETWDQFIDRIDRVRDGLLWGVDPLDRADPPDEYPLDEREAA